MTADAIGGVLAVLSSRYVLYALYMQLSADSF
jgi:hypothetical protein